MAEFNPPGKKYDTGKLRYDLVPVEALDQLVAVVTYGATKYAPDNWRGVSGERYMAAALRHITAHMRADRTRKKHVSVGLVPALVPAGSVASVRLEENRKAFLDKETGLPHLAHAACCIMFALENEFGELDEAALAKALVKAKELHDANFNRPGDS